MTYYVKYVILYVEFVTINAKDYLAAQKKGDIYMSSKKNNEPSKYSEVYTSMLKSIVFYLLMGGISIVDFVVFIYHFFDDCPSVILLGLAVSVLLFLICFDRILTLIDELYQCGYNSGKEDAEENNKEITE